MTSMLVVTSKHVEHCLVKLNTGLRPKLSRLVSVFDLRESELTLYVSLWPGFILARVVRVKNENGQKFTRKK